MDKLLAIILMFLVLSVSCSRDTKNMTAAKNTHAPVNSLSTVDAVRLDPEDIKSIFVRDTDIDTQDVEYKNGNLIKEFCTFLKNQNYSETEEKWDEIYSVELLDKDGIPVSEIAFGERAVTFDKKVELGDKIIAKGTYEVEHWMSNYLKNLYEGVVLDPEYVRYPARLKVPDASYALEIYDMGSSRVNKYEVCQRLYDFIGSWFSCKEFEITESKRIYDNNSIESEISKIKNGNRCIIITYSTSDNYFDINFDIASADEYKESARGSAVILAKYPEKPNTYILATDNTIFHIKVSSDFNSRFESIFSDNGSIIKEISPGEIKDLFDAKKPYFMEFVSKNLGTESWPGREPDRLEIKQIKLDNGSAPYTSVNITNPFDLRMLIFKQNKDKTWNFIDSIDFGGRVAGTEYSLKKAGDNIWLAGNRCRGNGTGIAKYYEDWYSITDEGKKLVLSFPYDEYEEPPSGGYNIKADSIKFSSGGSAKVTVSYSVAKRFLLGVDSAGEDGKIEVTGKKLVEFKWEDAKKIFMSEYATDEYGVTDVSPECEEIARKCNEILEKDYEVLLENLKKLASEKDENKESWRIDGLREFLDNCADCDKKAGLYAELKKDFPD